VPGVIPTPSDTTDALAWADWLELTALASVRSNASYGDLTSVLKRLGMEGAERISTGAMNELNRRVIAAAESYPFAFSGTLLSQRDDWHSFSPYVFCLLLSYAEEQQKRVRNLHHERMFEQLSCIAARRYIGGEVLRFGYPRMAPVPAGFKEALVFVSGKVGEWIPSQRVQLRKNDDGLDLIAWKPFPDRQAGKLVLFGHCASGGNWDSKVNELQPGVFCTKWLGGEKSPLLKAFFIPHRLSPDVFEDRAPSARLFFDRCRIAYWADNGEFGKATSQANVRWCEKLLSRLVS
jgi:hypothetical protein